MTPAPARARQLGPVSVPATSANLGCLFDTAGLALPLRLRAKAEVRAGTGQEVVQLGPEGRSLVAGQDLVAGGIRAACQWAGVAPPALRVSVHSEVPVGMGLGSSAAATLAGLLLGLQLVPQKMATAELLGLAAGLEGHPDNVAAAYLGGLTVAAALEDGGVAARTARLPARMRLVVVIPETGVATASSRRRLPTSYRRRDAVHNLQRAALLTASVFSGRFDIGPELFSDRWHQPQRVTGLPGAERCLDFRHPGLLGSWLSGSGPAIVGLALRDSAEEVAAGMARQHREGGGGPAGTLVVAPANHGARVWSPR